MGKPFSDFTVGKLARTPSVGAMGEAIEGLAS
jgi:hypothetical protein